MTKGFVYLRPTRLVSVRAVGPYQETVPAAWTRLTAWLRERGHDVRGPRYGLAHDNPLRVDPAQCRYDAACEIPEPFEGVSGEMRQVRLPSGAFIRHRIVGRYADLLANARPIYNEDRPANGLTTSANRPVVLIYFHDPLDRETAGRKADVCLPVSANEHDGDKPHKTRAA